MPAEDLLRTNSFTMNWPAEDAFVITPNDDEELSYVTRALYVGGEGDVCVVMAKGTEPIIFPGMAGGYEHPLRVRKVLATGTTATGLRGLHR